MRETAGDRKIHFDSFELFFEGPTLLSPFLSSRTLLSKPHFFEHFFELITQKSTFLSALLSTVTFLRTFLRTQKSGFTLLSTFLSGFTHLRAFLSAQKSPQGHSGPLWDLLNGKMLSTLFRPFRVPQQKS